MIEPKPIPDRRQAEFPFADSAAGSWQDRMRVALADRRSTVAELDALSDGAAIATLAAGDTTSIRSLLSKRQRLVDRLVAGQPEFLGLVADLERGLSGLAEDEAKELRDGVAGFAAALARVGEQSDRAHAVVREACGGRHASTRGEAA
jgi:ABC-type transporter Mla subunit MlaD